MRRLLWIFLLGLLVYALTGVTQVRPGEVAVVRRFGRVVDKPGPGLYVGLPAGMDRVDRVQVDLARRVLVGHRPGTDEGDRTTPLGQLLTGDYNLVDVQAVLEYAVQEERIEDYVTQADRVDGVLARAAEAVLAEWVAGRKVDEVLLRGKTELPDLLVRRVRERVAPYQLGVVIQSASIGYLYPPREVKAAFEEVAQAETAIGTREQEALQEAARKLREAEIDRHRLERQTAAYVQEQLTLARAEAQTFEQRLRQYQQLRRENPHFLAGIWWDQIGKLFRRMKENDRLDFLDKHLGPDGLDITVAPPMPKK
jgi:membrane protease subunit HflK